MIASGRKIKILLLEDNSFDAVMIEQILRKSGILFDFSVAGTRHKFTTQLEQFQPDIILSDYSMTEINGMEALKLCKAAHPDIPFIFVTGTIGDEQAITTLKEGADDFILKMNLARLPTSIARALQIKKEREERKQIATALQQSREYQELMLASLPMLIFISNPDDNYNITWASESAYDITGFTSEQFIRNPDFWRSGFHPEEYQKIATDLNLLTEFKNELLPLEYRWLCSNGQYRWFSSRIRLITNGSKRQLAGTMLDVTKQKQIDAIFMKAMVETQEEEKSRFAQELHDGIGQMLTAVNLNLSGMDIGNFNETQKKIYINTISILENAIQETRSIAHHLMPKALSDFGLISTLEDLCDKMTQSTSIAVHLSYYGLNERLDKSIELIIYRICQELMNNVIKHSNANIVTIQLAKHQDSLIFIFEDNGTGFVTEKNSSNGIGLKNIETRIRSLNGTLFIDSIPGKGIVTTVEIPLIVKV